MQPRLRLVAASLLLACLTTGRPAAAFEDPLIAFEQSVVQFDAGGGVSFDNPLIAFEDPLIASDAGDGVSFDNPLIAAEARLLLVQLSASVVAKDGKGKVTAPVASRWGKDLARAAADAGKAAAALKKAGPRYASGVKALGSLRKTLTSLSAQASKVRDAAALRKLRSGLSSARSKARAVVGQHLKLPKTKVAQHRRRVAGTALAAEMVRMASFAKSGKSCSACWGKVTSLVKPAKAPASVSSALKAASKATSATAAVGHLKKANKALVGSLD